MDGQPLLSFASLALKVMSSSGTLIEIRAELTLLRPVLISSSTAGWASSCTETEATAS